VHCGDISRSTVVNKFAFPSDTRSVLGTGLSVAKMSTFAVGNHNVAGYIAGGISASAVSDVVDKFAFPSDTRSVLGTGLSAPIRYAAGAQNSGNAGYFAGGMNISGVRINTADKFAFPLDTRTTISVLSSSREQLAPMSNEGVL
jgi:hypothetical protein